MLRLTHNHLGQVTACPSGYTDQTIDCGAGMQEDYIPNTQCSRCVPKTAIPVSQNFANSDSDCIGIVQKYLNQQGLLQPQFVTGSWGPETEAALNIRVPTWRNTPGGACGLLTVLSLQPPSTGFPKIPGTASTDMLIVGGLGLLVVLALVMGKQKAAAAPAAA